MEAPMAALSATDSCIIVTSLGAGVPFSSALAIASWKKTISEPETKKRWSMPPSFIDATMASDHSSAACSCQIPADCVASMLQGLLFLDCEDDLQGVVQLPAVHFERLADLLEGQLVRDLIGQVQTALRNEVCCSDDCVYPVPAADAARRDHPRQPFIHRLPVEGHRSGLMLKTKDHGKTLMVQTLEYLI